MTYFPDNLTDRYRRFRFRHFAAHQDHYEELATSGQHPEVMVVGCCDSRVDPETIFGSMPGELFTVRNVANLVPPYETTGRYHGVSAALEYATLNLRVRHIIIMGHSACGGIRAALDQGATRESEAQFISGWMSILDEARYKVIADLSNRPIGEQRLALEQAGIVISLANLRTFPYVKDLEARGRLQLHGAHFDIASGRLSVFNPATSEFVAL